MISEKFAGRILIVGIVCSVLWLGGCMVDSFLTNNTHTAYKK